MNHHIIICLGVPFACVECGGSLFFRNDLRTVTILRLINTAVAVERLRLRSDSPPATLDELVPAFLKSVPEDPFDSRPLRYKKPLEGYVVYNVGEDGKDDGGKDVKGEGDAGVDVTFTVER